MSPIGLATPDSAAQAQEGLSVTEAWVAPSPQVGADIPLSFTVRNAAGAPDALLRVRCPVANFTTKHTVDRGEGGKAMREVPQIPIPPGGTVVLKPTEFHVMLLQTRQPLEAGARFNCAIVFQKAGTIETEVEVRQSP